MYTKENLKSSLTHEFNVIRHLFTKIPEGGLDYKPTEKQRTILELLQYLSVTAPMAVAVVCAGDSKAYAPYAEKSKTVTAENFLERLKEGEIEVMATLDKMTSEDLSQNIDVFMMGSMSKGVYLVETTLKWMAAYKMQLFLYIKASGNTSIGTSNLWGGMDMPVK